MKDKLAKPKGKVSIHSHDGQELFSGEGEIIGDVFELMLPGDIFDAVECAMEQAEDIKARQEIIFEADQFDRLTALGYRLDLIEWRYYEPTLTKRSTEAPRECLRWHGGRGWN